MQPLRDFGPPAADVLGPLPYTALQGMFDEGAPEGLHNYWKSHSHYLHGLDDAVIDVILEHAAALPVPFGQIHLHQLQGAVARVPAGATAFGHRDAAFAFNAIGTRADPAESDMNVR